MKIGGTTRDLLIALFSALVGALASYAVQISTAPRSEVTIRSTAIRSQFNDYVQGVDDKIPSLGMHYFAIKNTGERPLTNVTIEFAPAGGDAAYDETSKQRAWIDVSPDGVAGRYGVQVRRTGNTFFVTYARLKSDEATSLVITNDGLAYEYDVELADPNIVLVQESAEADFPMIAIPNSLMTFAAAVRLAAIFSLLAGLVVGAAVYVLMKRRRANA